MTKQESVHVVRLTPGCWYAEIREDSGVRLLGRGGFRSEHAARTWATEVHPGQIYLSDRNRGFPLISRTSR
jgi:hypothetical protein